MGKLWSSKWYCVVWGIVGFLVLSSGVVSGNIVTKVVGAMLLFAVTSGLLTSYVKGDHIVKRALEVIFMFLSFGVAVYGYVITGSFILGVITLFIVAMVFFAFVVSYLLPRIRSNRMKI
jgi:hypothetical protein